MKGMLYALRRKVLRVLWKLKYLVQAQPDDERLGRCDTCRDWTPLFVCEVCGCTGSVEYTRDLNAAYERNLMRSQR